MKTKILLISLLLALSSCTGCEKEEEWDTLPPETQTGANTFGCYVNGELFVKGKGRFSLFPVPILLSAEFINETKRLVIHSTSKDAHLMNLVIDNPQEKVYNSLLYGDYVPQGTRDCFCFACEHIGRIFFTKFDTINRIVSGTFEFPGRCSPLGRDESGNLLYSGDSIVNITNGRFDIKLSVYDINN